MTLLCSFVQFNGQPGIQYFYHYNFRLNLKIILLSIQWLKSIVLEKQQGMVTLRRVRSNIWQSNWSSNDGIHGKDWGIHLGWNIFNTPGSWHLTSKTEGDTTTYEFNSKGGAPAQAQIEAQFGAQSGATLDNS